MNLAPVFSTYDTASAPGSGRHGGLHTGFIALCFFCASVAAASAETIRVLKLSDGQPFQMGKVASVRIVHPEMGTKKLTLNYSTSEPGFEFPQHVHDYSDDTILVLRGQGDLRQGDSRRPIRAGECAFVPAGQIHGTITTGTAEAVMISFQTPPDLVLYTGARDSSRPGAAPPKGVITPGAVKFVDFANQNGFFVHPRMGAERVAVAHRGSLIFAGRMSARVCFEPKDTRRLLGSQDYR